jgi:hypothetical protein
MKYNKSKIRTRLTDENLEHSMRFSLSNTNVNIDRLLVQLQGHLDTNFFCRSLYYEIYVELYTKALYYK